MPKIIMQTSLKSMEYSYQTYFQLEFHYFYGVLHVLYMNDTIANKQKTLFSTEEPSYIAIKTPQYAAARTRIQKNNTGLKSTDIIRIFLSVKTLLVKMNISRNY